MAQEEARRKLSAILSADVKGYSRLMNRDEETTVKVLKRHRDTISRLVGEHRGRVVDSPGDNILAEFGSVVDAVRCAVEIQQAVGAGNAQLPEDQRMDFRIGVNLGDVLEEEGRIYGDGVNIAARLEGLADARGICISGTAFDQVKNKVQVGYRYLGKRTVKNISDPVRVYKVLMEPEAAGKVIGEGGAESGKRRWKTVAAAVAALLLLAGGLVWNTYLRTPPIEPAALEKMAFPLPEKPSIAVLPFANMSGDVNQEYLADGITENIITALSKIPEIFVIARNSVFTYKGKPVKIRQVSEELGVRYVLEGSVQKSGSRLRITAQLIDATGAHHLWAERFDRDLKDVFALQDEVTLRILSALRPEFSHREHARAQETTDNLEAWSYFVKGLSHFELFTKEDNARAQELFGRAVTVDPEYSYAWAMLGWTHLLDATYGYSDSRDESFKKATEIAQKAMAMDDKLPDVHALRGWIYLFQRKYDKAVAEGEKSVALAPNVACNKVILAQTLLFAGRTEDAISMVKGAMRLSPHYPAWYLGALAMAYGMAGEHEKAVAAYRELLELRRKSGGNIVTPLVGLAAAYVFLDRVDDARDCAGEILQLDPGFSLEKFWEFNFFKDPSRLKPTLEALQKAGLPEHPPLPLPEKPSIAVLPFRNMSGDPEKDYFSDGLSEEIITALSKSLRLFVIARESSFFYKGKPIHVQQVGRDLGVGYLLEGSVRMEGHKVRITAQLIDSATARHLWAETYDREMEHIFAIQDEITRKIMGALQVKLTDGEQALLYAKGTRNLQAFLKCLQGREFIYRFSREGIDLARPLLKQAITLDPDYAAPYRWLGGSHMLDVILGESKNPKESITTAFRLARKALSVDDSFVPAHCLLARLYAFTGQYEKAVAQAQRAVAINPNSADAYDYLGHVLCQADRAEEAIPLIKKGIRLNPIPPKNYLYHLAMAYSSTEQYEEAVSVLKRVLNRDPNDFLAHLLLVVCYSRSGRELEARAEAAEVLRIKPGFRAEMLRTMSAQKNRARVETGIAALRKAGLK